MLRPLLLISFLEIAHSSCPKDFDLIRNGQCTGLYSMIENLPFKDATNVAKTKCNEIDGQPPIIHNDQEQSYWTDWKVNTVKPGNTLPLGLVCNSTSLHWQWTDGSAVDFKPPTYHTALDANCNDGCSWSVWTDGYWNYVEFFFTLNCSDDTKSLTYVFCTTQLKQPIPTPDGCESFEDDNDDGVCYQIASVTENWQEAKKICRSFGADLASIHNQRENSFIRRLAVSNGHVKGVFLGATISGKGNQFAWTDGSDWDFDNFNPGFPINGLGDCLAMDTEGTSGYWVNTDCSSTLSVACMRKENYTAPACTSGVYTEGQIIYSPGFPYDASTPCDFILTVDAGKRVQVEVLFLEANSCCDHLILFDNYIAGNVIANLTGEISETVYNTSPSNLMRVSWQPNGGVNVQGMMMTFRGV